MQRFIIIILSLVLLVVTTSCRDKEQTTVSLEQAETTKTEEILADTAQNDYVYVYVCGAVNSEGVYQLPTGSRVYEAIESAGGFKEDAAKASVNQAKVLSDEESIYVPTMGEQIEPVIENDGKVNINCATKEELMNLPGIGESRADSIIKYREKNGGFQTIEDIMQVSGIKGALFEQIKDLIKV